MKSFGPFHNYVRPLTGAILGDFFGSKSRTFGAVHCALEAFQISELLIWILLESSRYQKGMRISERYQPRQNFVAVRYIQRIKRADQLQRYN